MFSDRIFDSSVERAIPSFAAPLDGPKPRLWLSRKAASITSVSLAPSINEKCGLHPNLVSRGCCDSQLLSTEKSWLSQQPRDTRLGCRPHFSLMLAAKETEVIEEALRESQGRVFGPSGAAAKLGIARSTLESKIRSLNINKKRFTVELGT